MGVTLDEFMNMNNQSVRQLADGLEIDLPKYAEQFSLLSAAKSEETFNYTRYIGTSRKQIDVLRAFVLMRVGEMLHPIE